MMLRTMAAIGVGSGVLGVSTLGMVLGAEPFATWYYSFAWYATLLVADGIVSLRTGRFYLLANPRFALSLAAWSIPFWLFFELFNLRLQNWHYVCLPADPIVRQSGILLAFATVLPAIFLAQQVLASFGLLDRTRTTPVRLTPVHLKATQMVGSVCLLLPLAWPNLFFPLVWVGGVLLIDPWVYRRQPDRSLLGDLQAGRLGRALRLSLGGLAIGFVWELFNFGARAKWIYTVPGFESPKLFEMPLLGYLGFVVFALEGFAAYQALATLGVAQPESGPAKRAPRPVMAVAVFLAMFVSFAALIGMERRTIKSLESGCGEPAAESAPLVVSVIRSGVVGVAAEGVVPGDLMGRQDLDHLQVREQVCGPKLAVEPGDLGQLSLQRRTVDRSVRELVVQAGLGVDDPLTKCDRAFSHRLEDALRSVELVGRQLESLGQIEHVPRTGVVVEFGHLREPHPISI